MPTTSLIEELPKIVKEGRQEAQRILERLSSTPISDYKQMNWFFPPKTLPDYGKEKTNK